LKEYPAPLEDDAVDLAANEAKTIAALTGESFPRLFGKLQMDFAGGNSEEGDRAWITAMGVPPPRKGSTWLVFAYDGDGGNTLLSFSRPTKIRVAAAVEARGGRRSLALPPLPRDVSWVTTTRFVIRGCLPQALNALACLHEAGYAHRVLSAASIQLGAKTGMNKNVALEYCDPSMLSIKFSDFGRATSLDGDTLPGGGLTLVAEDLRALGLIFLQLLLGALAETISVDPSTSLYVPLPRPPPVTSADLVRQLALFDGRIAGDSGFSEFCRGEPAWSKVVALLDADDGAGWQFLELLVGAPTALSVGGADGLPALRSARGMTAHPFLQTQAIERVTENNSPKDKLFGLFGW